MRAEAATARLQYDRCTLRAPIRGVVRLVRARPFAVVEEFEVLFWVANPSVLRASLYLPPTMRGKIKQGNRVQISPATNTGSKAVRGRVRLVNPVADPVTGLFRVEIEVVSGAGLEAGTDVQITFGEGTAEEATVMAGLSGAVLPANTYLERDGAEIFTYVIDAGIARRVAVELGEIGPGGFRVLSGVSAGDLVISAGQIPPGDGAPVEAHLTSSPAP
jgi:membrane fusion protein (multidrug efflux system)